MKKFLLFITIALVYSITFSQSHAIARGAAPGELYLTSFWYGIYGPQGPPYYDTVRTAVYRLTNHGENLTLQYDVDYFADLFTEPGSVMQPAYILADATTGVLYARRVYEKNWYDYTQLWVSFDYGKNWVFREENIGSNGYFVVNVEGLMYKSENGTFKSTDFSETFLYLKAGNFHTFSECGIEEEEVFAIIGRSLLHTCDLYQTGNVLTIGEEYASSALTGFFPDVYRGGLEGEVYIHSWFPGHKFRASFSADTGYTFRHVYVNDTYQWQYNVFDKNQLLFMSDREPGVFYILHLNEVKDTNPWGWHLELCIEYYRDYGATLVDIYCHDVNKNYGIEHCATVNDLSSEIINDNAVLLTWTEPENDGNVEGYRVFRNHKLVTEPMLTKTFYVDENLSVGEYEYNVLTYYTNGCISEISNVVTETIELGVRAFDDGIVVYPNPTTGELRVTSYELQVTEVEVFDVYGRKLSHISNFTSQIEINISHLYTGLYLIKITTEKGITTKKIIKY